MSETTTAVEDRNAVRAELPPRLPASERRAKGTPKLRDKKLTIHVASRRLTMRLTADPKDMKPENYAEVDEFAERLHKLIAEFMGRKRCAASAARPRAGEART